MVEKCSSCDGSGQMPVTQVQYADGAKFDIKPGLDDWRLNTRAFQVRFGFNECYDVPCLDCSGKGER